MPESEPAERVARRLARQHTVAQGEGVMLPSPFIGADVARQAAILPRPLAPRQPQVGEAAGPVSRSSRIHDIGAAAISRLQF